MHSEFECEIIEWAASYREPWYVCHCIILVGIMMAMTLWIRYLNDTLVSIFERICVWVSFFYCTIRHNRHIFIRMLIAMGARQCVRYCRLQLALCQIHMKLPYNKKHHTTPNHTTHRHHIAQSNLLEEKNTTAKRRMWNTIKMPYKTVDLLHPFFSTFRFFTENEARCPDCVCIRKQCQAYKGNLAIIKMKKRIYKYIWESLG